MSYSISTLLTRNLQDVFGENDPARRRAAIDEIFTEDGVFYDPKGVYRGREEIDRVAGAIRATHPDFRYQPIAGAEENGNSGRIQWVSGRPGEAPAYAGTDFIIAQAGRPGPAGITIGRRRSHRSAAPRARRHRARRGQSNPVTASDTVTGVATIVANVFRLELNTPSRMSWRVAARASGRASRGGLENRACARSLAHRRSVAAVPARRCVRRRRPPPSRRRGAQSSSRA
jgi:SnoaL-like protein